MGAALPADLHSADASFLSGKRVLVVEDEYLIASDLSRRLVAMGAVVAGPVATIDQALALAEEPLDAAVLDINLREQMAHPVALELERRHVPYVITTGYEKSSLPKSYTGMRTLEKPVAFEELTSALIEAMKERRDQAMN